MSDEITPTLLVIEDMLDIATLLKVYFSELGIKVSLAEDARTAIRKIRETHFDVMLVDYKLPDMNGGELLEYILLENLVDPKKTAFIAFWKLESNGFNIRDHLGIKCKGQYKGGMLEGAKFQVGGRYVLVGETIFALRWWEITKPFDINELRFIVRGELRNWGVKNNK